MKTCISFAAVSLMLLSMMHGKDRRFYGDPPDATHPWAVHDPNRPQPVRVEPSKVPGGAPSDAVVLFDGTEKSFQNWEHVKQDRNGDWVVKDGVLQCTPRAGFIRTKESFGDCQLHIEWASPVPPSGTSQERGNSGVFLMGIAEVQVLDNYNNPTYSDGFAGSVYGVMPPMVNPLNPSGEWQVYDIVFRRPIVKEGQVLDQGSMTVFVNGVLVQDATPLEGGGGHKKRSVPKAFPEVGPLQIQDHGNPVRYRNIWIRNIRPRPVDGGTDGQLSPEATTAKRAEIAGSILKRAASQSGVDQMMSQMESLVYQDNAEVMARVVAQGDKFVSDLRSMDKNQLGKHKPQVLELGDALDYMVQNKRLPADLPFIAAIQELIRSNDWLPKKP